MMHEFSIGPSAFDYSSEVQYKDGRSIFQYTPSVEKQKNLYKPHTKQAKTKRLSVLSTNDEKINRISY